MFAVWVNVAAIVLGTLVGLLLRRGISEALSDTLMKGLGLCTIVIGMKGTLAEENMLVLTVCIVTGIAIGETLDWDGHVNRFTERVAARFAGGEGEAVRIARAFITSCLIMNVGAMVIVGSLQAGLSHDYTMLYTKSLLDLVSGVMMAAAMGVGVMGSAAFTLVFQGSIVLLAQVIAPFMSDALIRELSCTGSLMILAIGFNMIGLTKFKVINFIPALLVVPVVMGILH